MDFDLSEIALVVERITEEADVAITSQDVGPRFEAYPEKCGTDPFLSFGGKAHALPSVVTKPPSSSGSGSNNGSINAATPSVGPVKTRNEYDSSDGENGNSHVQPTALDMGTWQLNPNNSVNESFAAGMLTASLSLSGHHTPIPVTPITGTNNAIRAPSAAMQYTMSCQGPAPSIVPQYGNLNQKPTFAAAGAVAGLDAFHEAASLKGVKGVPLRMNRQPQRNYESTAGIFVGQLPVLYSPHDVVQLLSAVGAESGVDVQVKDVKMHPRNTCAFVDVNAECIPALVKYNRMVLCDVHTLWFATDPARVPDLLQIAEHCCNRNYSGVPRTTVVLEQSTRDPYTGRRQRPTKFNPAETSMQPLRQVCPVPFPYQQHHTTPNQVDFQQLNPGLMGAPFHPAATSNSFLHHPSQQASQQPTLVLDARSNKYMYVMVEGSTSETNGHNKGGSFTVHSGSGYKAISQIQLQQQHQPPNPWAIQQQQQQVPHCSTCRVPYVAGLVSTPPRQGPFPQCALCYSMVATNTIAHRCDVCKTHICLKCMGTVVATHKN